MVADMEPRSGTVAAGPASTCAADKLCCATSSPDFSSCWVSPAKLNFGKPNSRCGEVPCLPSWDGLIGASSLVTEALVTKILSGITGSPTPPCPALVAILATTPAATLVSASGDNLVSWDVPASVAAVAALVPMSMPVLSGIPADRAVTGLNCETINPACCAAAVASSAGDMLARVSTGSCAGAGYRPGYRLWHRFQRRFGNLACERPPGRAIFGSYPWAEAPQQLQPDYFPFPFISFFISAFRASISPALMTLPSGSLPGTVLSLGSPASERSFPLISCASTSPNQQ